MTLFARGTAEVRCKCARILSKNLSRNWAVMVFMACSCSELDVTGGDKYFYPRLQNINNTNFQHDSSVLGWASHDWRSLCWPLPPASLKPPSTRYNSFMTWTSITHQMGHISTVTENMLITVLQKNRTSNVCMYLCLSVYMCMSLHMSVYMCVCACTHIRVITDICL